MSADGLPPLNALRAFEAAARLGSLSRAADELHVTHGAVSRQVRLLEEAGVIERYVAVVDGARVGAGLTVFARVWFKTQDAEVTHQFAEAVRRFPEVVECYLTTGECDALLRIVTADLNSYWRFQADHLTRIPSVQSVKTDVPMETVKRSFEIPLP